MSMFDGPWRDDGETIAKCVTNGKARMISGDAEARERVIRCRDCRFFEPEFVYEEIHDEVHCSEFLHEPPGCKRFHSNNVEPDGFCMWAEPKEES